MVSRALTALLSAVLLASLPVGVSAQDNQGLGVTPAEIQIETGQQGEAYKATVSVQNEFDSETRIILNLTGEVGAWTTTDHAEPFTIPARTHESVGLTIAIPEDAANGSYQGTLEVTADPKEQPSGSGAAIHYSVAVLLNVTIGGDPVKDLRWERATADDVEVGSTPHITARVVNSGNVRDTAQARATITPLGGSSQMATATAELRLDPGEQAVLTFPFDEALPEGQYQVHVRDDQGTFESTLPFKVVPPGLLGKDGNLRFISHEPWVEPGRPVEISGVFENTGDARIARATFTGRVFLDGELVGALESQPRLVEVGRVVNLTDVFTPEEPGGYIITGKVTYDGFETDEKESLLNVQGEATGTENHWISKLPYLVIGLLAAWLLAIHLKRRRDEGTPPDDPDDPHTPR